MNSGLFDKILCFSQVNFQPSATHKFVMDLALSHFIFNRPKIENILHDHQNIGAHTDIVQFQAGIVTTFRWTHPGARPLGFGVYNQCLNCKRLKTQTAKPNDDHSKILLKCRECKAEFVFNLERGWRWVRTPPAKGDVRGAWLVLTEVRAEMDTTI